MSQNFAPVTNQQSVAAAYAAVVDTARYTGMR